MKILYASGLSPKESSLYRLWALERLGHHVIPFNTFDYHPRNPIIRKAAHRLSAGSRIRLRNPVPTVKLVKLFAGRSKSRRIRPE